jgi:putative intracellular protease/amidase
MKKKHRSGKIAILVVDGELVTSRKPADIPAFNDRMLKAFGSREKRRG